MCECWTKSQCHWYQTLPTLKTINYVLGKLESLKITINEKQPTLKNVLIIENLPVPFHLSVCDCLNVIKEYTCAEAIKGEVRYSINNDIIYYV